jgi:hypothetical protein
VILKDVLGHSIDEVASIADCTPAAAKSALQRGRRALRQLAQVPTDTWVPLMSVDARQKMATFVDLFRIGDIEAIRAMLADEVKPELVNRLKWEGRDKIVPYFTRYADETKWRFSLGAVEGRPAMLVFESGAMEKPAYFVLGHPLCETLPVDGQPLAGRRRDAIHRKFVFRIRYGFTVAKLPGRGQVLFNSSIQECGEAEGTWGVAADDC